MFKRKPGLGHYNVPRSVWVDAYRKARILHPNGSPQSATSIEHKAYMIVLLDRVERPAMTTRERFEFIKTTDQLLDKILAESPS